MTPLKSNGFDSATLRARPRLPGPILAVLALLGAMPRAARAEGATNTPTKPAASTSALAASEPSTSARPKVRVAFGSRATEKISGVRLRRLVAIQLAGAAEVAAEPNGPLDEASVRVFVEFEAPTLAMVQVQAAGRRVDVRSVDVDGLPWDVALRFIAIGVSEAVRAQLSPLRRPRSKPLPEAEILAEHAKRSTLELRAQLVGHYVGSNDAMFVGSRLELGVRQPWLDAFASLGTMGSVDGDAVVTLGLGARRSIWVDPDGRLEVGAGARAAIGERGSRGDDGPPTGIAWLEAHASLATQWRIDGSMWISAAVEPGLSVDPNDGALGPSAALSVGLGFDEL